MRDKVFRGRQSIITLPQGHQTWVAAIVFFALGLSALAQQNAPSTNAAAYAVADSGPNFRIWQQAVASTNGQGQVINHINSYTELATGLNFLSNGVFVPASENIQITAGGGAATNGQHQV